MSRIVILMKSRAGWKIPISSFFIILSPGGDEVQLSPTKSRAEPLCCERCSWGRLLGSWAQQGLPKSLDTCGAVSAFLIIWHLWSILNTIHCYTVLLIFSSLFFFPSFPQIREFFTSLSLGFPLVSEVVQKALAEIRGRNSNYL